MFSLLFAAASILGPENETSSPSTNPSDEEETGVPHRDLHRRKRRITYEDLRHITSTFNPNDPQKEKMLRCRSLRRYPNQPISRPKYFYRTSNLLHQHHSTPLP